MDFATLVLDQVLQPYFYYSVILSIISFIGISLLLKVNRFLNSRLRSIAYLIPFVLPFIIVLLYPPITSITAPDPSKISLVGYIAPLQPQSPLPSLDHYLHAVASSGSMTVNTLPIDQVLSVTGLLCLAGLVLCVIWLVFSMALGSRLTWRTLRVVELKPDDYPDLQASTLDLAKNMGISRPRIGLVEDLRPNAFIFGGSKKPVIVLSLGLIELLDDDEVRAVVAHELAHIKHHDPRFRTIACALGWISFFNPLALVALRMALREREKMADQEASIALEDETTLIKAIRKVSFALPSSGGKPFNGFGQGFFLVSSLSSRISLLSTHPSVTDRVNNIGKGPRVKPTTVRLIVGLILSLLIIIAAGMVTVGMEQFREGSIKGGLDPMRAGSESNTLPPTVLLLCSILDHKAPHDPLDISSNQTDPSGVLDDRPMPVIVSEHQLKYCSEQ